MEDYQRGKYGFTYRIKRINTYLLACNNNTNINNNFISVFPRYYVVLPTVLNNFQYVLFIRYSNEKSELKTQLKYQSSYFFVWILSFGS